MNLKEKGIKLIASDLDGTLITEGMQNLEEGFLDVLQEILDSGIDFYIASGRPHVALQHLFPDNLKNRMGFISENGSLIMEQDEVSWVHKLPEKLAKSVSEDIFSDPRADIFISGVTNRYMKPKTDFIVDILQNVIKADAREIDAFDDIKEPVIKIALFVYDYEKNAPILKRELTEKYGEFADFAFSGNGWMDLIPKDCNKGTALQVLLKRRGLKPEELMVFGDNENDVPMLSLTSNSFAKPQSPGHVKQAAGAVCESVTEVLKEGLR